MVPLLIVVPPPYPLAAASVRLPEPACVNEPVPLMVFPTVGLLVRLNFKAPLSVTEPVPSEPVVVALPICKVLGPLIVVVVEPFVDPVRITVPEPTIVRPTPPPMVLLRVMVPAPPMLLAVCSVTGPA